MINVAEIEIFIQDNPNVTAAELFTKYRMDTLSLLIASILANLEYQDILEAVREKESFEDVYELIDTLINYPKLFDLIVPKNVYIADLLFQEFENPEKSKGIIEVIKEKSDYLPQIKKRNLFDSDIVFFSMQPSLREDDLMELIKEKVQNLDVSFLEPAHKQFMSHFELVPFFVFDIENEKKFIETINKNINDAILPSMIQQKAEILNDCIKVCFDLPYLEKAIDGLVNVKVDWTQLAKNFETLFTSDMKDELVDSGFKFTISNLFSLSTGDVKIKVLKNFLYSLEKTNLNLSEDAINEHYYEFEKSKEDHVKHWFINKKKKEFNSALKSTGFSIDINVPDKVFDRYYHQFIERYLALYPLKVGGDIEIPDDHTDVFKTIYEYTNDLNIKPLEIIKTRI